MTLRLFQPDNLSVTYPTFIPVTQPKLINTIDYIFHRFFPIPEINTQGLIIQKYAGQNATRDNFKIQANTHFYLLKRKDGTDALSSLRNETHLLASLANRNLLVPKPCLTPQGEDVLLDENSCWTLAPFIHGTYFDGSKEQLISAFLHYAQISQVANNLTKEGVLHLRSLKVPTTQALIELPALINTPLIEEHERTIILEALSFLGTTSVSLIPFLPMHLDFHPLNLLFCEKDLVAVLDFEHFEETEFPVGLGFSAYKLIREAIVKKSLPVETGRILVKSVLSSWNDSVPFKNQIQNIDLIQAGAYQRVLFLIHKILTLIIKNGDDRFLYDLEKQIRSLHEIRNLLGSHHSV